MVSVHGPLGYGPNTLPPDLPCLAFLERGGVLTRRSKCGRKKITSIEPIITEKLSWNKTSVVKISAMFQEIQMT